MLDANHSINQQTADEIGQPKAEVAKARLNYDQTDVPVARSQEAIRKLVLDHKGFGTAFASETDPTTGQRTEGFHAKVLMDGKPYAIRITAAVVVRAKKPLTERQREEFVQREERRIWRVLYYHLKDLYAAADSGVMEFRTLILPHIVMADGSTIAERLLPRLDAVVASNRLLASNVGTEAAQ